MTVLYHDPFAEALVAPKTYDLSVDLAGSMTLALVANRIVDCDLFLSMVGDAVAGLRPGLDIRLFRTGNVTAAADTLIAEIAERCDAAVCAIGHCGSCTAGTVRDSLNLIERGIPSVALVTEPFWPQAKALSCSLGWSGAPMLRLPYPIWGTSADAQSRVAKAIASDLITHLEQADARTA